MEYFAPSFEVIGEISEIDVKEATEMQPKPSALVCITYGPERLYDNDSVVNFVNEFYVRLPYNTYSNRLDKLTVGRCVKIKGRIQSIHKHGADSPRPEMVAEAVFFATQS